MNAGNSTDAALVDLCQSAFHAEHHGQFQAALELHNNAVSGLTRLLANTDPFDLGGKRFAAGQIGFHSNRIESIKLMLEANRPTLVFVLPTSLSAADELQTRCSKGPLPISAEELWLAKHLFADKITEVAFPVDPLFQRLLATPAPFFTPTLDENLPKSTYHIYRDGDWVPFQHTQFYFTVQSDTDDPQTLYTFKAIKPRKRQIRETTFHRVADFTSPCVRALVAPIQQDRGKPVNAITGRPIDFHTLSSRVIREEPDRLDKPSWGPRRFTYAGRQFVWETEKKNHIDPQTLHEVEKVWPKPGSKTGKKEHKLIGSPICWGKYACSFKSKIAVIHMVGGLDQVFREYLLASQLTRLAIVHGQGI